MIQPDFIRLVGAVMVQEIAEERELEGVNEIQTSAYDFKFHDFGADFYNIIFDDVHCPLNHG